MAKLELPLLARASVALLLLLCLFFVIVGVSTAYWGVLTIDYLSLPTASEEFYYLGVWWPLDQATMGYLNAHQQAAKAFSVFSLIGSSLIIILYIGMTFAPRSNLPAKVSLLLPILTLIATAVTCCVQLILWSLMAGLYNRWRYALEAIAATTSSATRSYGQLSFSFALVLMANIGQVAALLAVYAILRLETPSAKAFSAAEDRRAASAGMESTEASARTRIDQLAAEAAGYGGGNVHFHRTRPAPPLPLPTTLYPQPPQQALMSSSIDASIPTPIRVIESSASPPPLAAVTTTDVDAEVNSTIGDNHSVENEDMLERLHQMTVMGSFPAQAVSAEAAVETGRADDEV